MIRTIAVFVLLALLHAGRLSAEPLIFSAIGCGPYEPEEEPLLRHYIAEIVNQDGMSEFLVHLGDIVNGDKEVWPESQYIAVADILKTSKVPVFVVPGDNEWNDLSNPDEGWKYWTKHFSKFEKNFKGAPQARRQKVRPENFAWVSKGVLLIGINLVGGRVHDAMEWGTRMQQDVDWIRENMEQSAKNVRAAVVFAQAKPSKDIEPFARKFGEVAKRFNKPVLFLHADGHDWDPQKEWEAPNVLRVMTDQVSRAPPVLVIVTDDQKEPFKFDRRLE